MKLESRRRWTNTTAAPFHIWKIYRAWPLKRAALTTSYTFLQKIAVQRLRLKFNDIEYILKFLVFVVITETWCGRLGMGYQWKHSFSGQFEAERAQYIKMFYKCQWCRCNFAEYEESHDPWCRDSICWRFRIPRWDNSNLPRTTQETENWRFPSKYINLVFEPLHNIDNWNVRLHKCLLSLFIQNWKVSKILDASKTALRTQSCHQLACVTFML